MELGFDFDGVMTDCGKLKTEGARRMYGVDIPPEKFKKEIVIGEGLLTAEQYRTLQQRIYGTREFGLLMEPVDGVLRFLPRLVAAGHTILVVTSRDNIQLQIAKEWSVAQGLQLEFVGVGYGASKADAAAGLDFYVDDDLDKLEPLVDVVPHLFLFSWGYNKHVDTGSIPRLDSWKTMYAVIQNMRR